MKKILLVLSAGLLLGGCKKEIKCSDTETKDLIKSKLFELLDNQAKIEKLNPDAIKWAKSNINVSLSMIQKISEDKDSGLQSCKAEISVNVPKSKEGDFYKEQLKSGWMLSSLKSCKDEFNRIGCDSENGSVSTKIAYTVSVTEDTNQVIVDIEKPTLLNGYGSLSMLMEPVYSMGSLNSIDEVVDISGVVFSGENNHMKIIQCVKYTSSDYCDKAGEVYNVSSNYLIDKLISECGIDNMCDLQLGIKGEDVKEVISSNLILNNAEMKD